MVKLHARSTFYLFYVFKHLFPDVLQFLVGVFVFGRTDWKMYFLVVIVLAEILVIFWYIVINLHTKGHSCLICPTSRHILYSVPASSHHYCWQTVIQHKFETLGVSLDAEVEVTQFIT